MKVFDAEAHVVKEVGATTLWNQRRGHMSEKVMKMLVSKGRLLDMKI